MVEGLEELDGTPAGELAGVGSEFARQHLVCAESGEVDVHYSIGALPLSDGSEDWCAIAGITVISDQLLCAVPFEIWSKKIAERKLPARGLLKPLLVSVSTVDPGDRETPGVSNIKVWVGLLSHDLESQVAYGLLEDVTFPFSPVDGVVPYAYSLTELANERFVFLSAESGNFQEPQAEADGGPVSRATEAARLAKL